VTQPGNDVQTAVAHRPRGGSRTEKAVRLLQADAPVPAPTAPCDNCRPAPSSATVLTSLSVRSCTAVPARCAAAVVIAFSKHRGQGTALVLSSRSWVFG
jgi:hypothetical protein